MLRRNFSVVVLVCLGGMAIAQMTTPTARTEEKTSPSSFPATTPSMKNPSLTDVRKLYLEPMGGVDSKGSPLQLEQYIKAELSARLRHRITVVTRKEDADAVMVGTGDWRNTSGAALTGRYLGLHDTSTGAVSIEKEGVVLWSSEAGDRSLFMGTMSRNGPRKVASRIVKHLDSALQEADSRSSRPQK